MRKRAAISRRKSDLINAAIHTIARSGTADVTVAEIAREAGMSTALAHHYFGSKDQILLSAMREILRRYHSHVVRQLHNQNTPEERLFAVLDASLGPDHFDSQTVSAWLNLYVLAQKNPQAARLLSVYRRRLHSTLKFDLKALRPDRAEEIAATLGALIDGIYLRAALAGGDMTGLTALAATYLRGALGDHGPTP